jgi:hypothetical protein
VPAIEGADTVLRDVLGAFASVLRSNGLLAFTLERAVGEGTPDYQLQLHGRYRHSQAYVEQLLQSLGLHSTVMHADLRMEAGLPVPGLVVRATRASSCQSRSQSPGPLEIRVLRSQPRVDGRGAAW